MEYRAAALVLLVLCATVFTFTEGSIPACCLTTSKKISKEIAMRVRGYDIQTDTGSCEIKALILLVGKNKYCVDPHLEKRVLKYIKRNNRRQRHHNHKGDE